MACLAGLIAFPAGASSDPDAQLSFVAGLGWAVPSGSTIGDAYDGGPLARIGLALRGRSRFHGTLTAGLFLASATPSRPVFVERMESKLRWIPVSLEARYDLLERPRFPYFSVGAELWFLQESFDYRLAGADREADGDRVALGGVLGVGYELTDLSLPVRIGGRLAFASFERERLTSDGSVFGSGESETSTIFALGVEVEL